MRAWIVLALVGCAPEPRDPPANDVQIVGAHGDAHVELAHDLAMLATGRAASAADLERLRTAGFSRAAFDGYIEELLESPALGEIAVQALRLDQLNFPTIVRSSAVLSSQVIDGKQVYFTTRPCELAAAVSVEPWWDMDSRVLVCPDAYRPEVFWSGANACTGLMETPMRLDSPCGCGPNLIRCFKSDAERLSAQQKTHLERPATLASVVIQDRPLHEAFTSTHSYRHAINEFLYQRWRIENREVASLRDLPDWRAWPEQGQWAPRHEMRPGQHAGLFTTPNSFDTVRQRLTDLYDVLLCIQPDSSNVTTQAMLQIEKDHGADLRGARAGWEDLAKQPVCTNCHARLDYGSQFFSGWSWHYISTHYVAASQKDSPGPLYLTNIDDARGSAPRNPAGFMQLLLQQPEYPACVAQDLIRYAFGTRTSPALQELDATLQDIVRERGTFRQLMRATLARYTTDALGSPSNVVATADVKAFAEQHCARCHDEHEPNAPGVMLRGGDWCADAAQCKRVAIEALVAVTFDRMPKDQPLTHADKLRLLELLAPEAWPDGDARRRAMRYFRDVPESEAVHATAAILTRARTAPAVAPAPTIGANSSFSTSLATILSLRAAKTCGDDLACIADLLDPRTFEK